MNHLEDFNAIYTGSVDAVYRFCLRAVSRPLVAEDLTSEVYLLLHERQHELLPAQLPTWLFTMARRRAADFWRHHYVQQRWSSMQSPEPVALPLPEFSLEHVLDFCDDLQPIHRTCLILRFRHAMTRAEIAQHTSLPETEIKRHLRNALQCIRHHIESAPPPQPPPSIAPAPHDAAPTPRNTAPAAPASSGKAPSLDA